MYPPGTVLACSQLMTAALLPMPAKKDFVCLRLVHFSSDSMRTNFCIRAFRAARPQVWNYLSMDLRQPDLSYILFRQSSKTFLSGEWDQSMAWIPL